MAARSVLQFKVALLEVEPVVWRRIQITDLCSFWDLHVAIQNAMGWTDSHLHEFEMNHSIEKGKQYLGIPGDGYDDFHSTLPSWDYKVRDYLIINDQFIYRYDFGDGWEHRIEYEGLHDKEPGAKYPMCLAGERACPPEDVGGAPGYEDFLEAIKTPRHPERQSLLTWAGLVENLIRKNLTLKKLNLIVQANAGKLRLRDNVFLYMSFNDLVRSY